MFDAAQPITTAPTIAMDATKRTWVFFGSGRFVSNADVADASQQSYYGIKEPWSDSAVNDTVDINKDATDPVDKILDTNDFNEMTWEEVYSAYLLDVSNTMIPAC